MHESASDRLRAERKRLQLNQAELGKLAGVSKNTQMAYENGTSPITLDYLEKVAEHGADTTFIVTGLPKAKDVTPSVRDDEDIVELAEIDLRYGLGATFVDGPVQTEKRTFSRSWIRSFTQSPTQCLFWASGDGDSMEPTIRSGELILIDTSQKSPRMSEGIWAVALGDFGMIKRLHYAGPREGLKLVSDNALVPAISVAEDELHIIGRVVAVVRRL
ncbi:XRE family transcriptional regulator [Novosphingobium sp. MBES04]|uniref:XRE family transcriptional regulator n=1 Tax=Novosphingobium sp. MBES04 TaxID=1206458 RepID=UPI00069369E5|nr:LexA family transcriptional regulator [Novosphingobium sp. MBES04]